MATLEIRPETSFFAGQRELRARKETDEGIEGYLLSYLREEYLPGYDTYLKENFASYAHFVRLPEAVEDVVATLFSVPNISRVELSGGVARFIAHGMNRDYWEYMRFLQQEGRTCLTDATPRAKAFFEGPRGFAKDPDLDISIDGATIEAITHHLISLFQVRDMQRLDGRSEFKLFSDEDFTIEVSAGPIPTIPEIENIVVSILDSRTKKRIFHLDISQLPQDVQASVREKRRGWSTAKHDDVWAELFLDEVGNIAYRLSSEAVAVMRRADPIRTVVPAAVPEMAARSARISLMHSNEDTVDLDDVVPFIPRESIFSIRTTLRQLAKQRGSIPKNVIELLQEEVALWLTIDPFQAVQMLRDSNFAAHIPRLRNLHPTRWDAILKSNSFGFEMEGTVPVDPAIRDSAYVHRQRLLYKCGTDRQGRRYFDGLRNFMAALHELGLVDKSHDNTWEEFFILWEEDPRAKVDAVDAGKKSYRVGRRFISVVPSDGLPLSDEERRQLGTALTKGKELEGAIDVVQSRATSELLMKLEDLELKNRGLIRDKLSRRQQIELRKLIESSMGYLYTIFQAYPAGLRAHELEEEYNSPLGQWNKVQFPVAFLGLKLLGLTYRYAREAESALSGETIPVEFYFLYPPHLPKHSLQELITSEEFRNAYVSWHSRQSKNPDLVGEKKYVDMLTHRLFFIVKILEDQYVDTIEVLEALSEIDRKLLDKTIPVGLSFAELALELRQAARWHFFRKWRRGRDVPTIYTESVFNSPAGRRLINEEGRA